MSVHTAVALLRDVVAGDGVSYCHSWRAARHSRVAALPIGYADGYRRGLSNRSQVRVEGRLAPVVGNVCMDTTLADVTDVPHVRVGSRVTVLEADAASPLSAAALAARLGTIPHEIITGIGRRVRRVAVDDAQPGV
jgi:alanine racemase